jgi:hypothetical protein
MYLARVMEKLFGIAGYLGQVLEINRSIADVI